MSRCTLFLGLASGCSLGAGRRHRGSDARNQGGHSEGLIAESIIFPSICLSTSRSAQGTAFDRFGNVVRRHDIDGEREASMWRPIPTRRLEKREK